MSLNLHQMDVSTAFLNGDLNEEIYMEQPPGFQESGQKNKVCKLKKALYGLKQAGRQWNKKLCEKLNAIGFINLKNEPCLFLRVKDDEFMLLATYVDDIVLVTNNNKCVDLVLREMNKSFDVKYIGKPKLCIGIEVDYDEKDGKISTGQESYIKKLLSKYGLHNAKQYDTPLEPKCKFEREPKSQTESKKVDKIAYQELIGSLIYLSVCTRPDIAYATNVLAQYNQDPRRQHWNGALHVLRYLKSTIGAKLEYRKSNSGIYGYVDASWAEDVDDRRSHSGYIFILSGSPISWESKKQRVVTTSSAEAEYVGLSSAAKEAAYLKQLIEEITGKISEPINIYNDSQAAQCIATFQGRHTRTKHIHYRYHYIREAIQNGVVKLEYMKTDEMPADGLTKPLTKAKHYYCCQKLGMKLKS